MKFLYAVYVFLCVSFSSLAIAGDKADIETLLNNFLANTLKDDLKNHNRFWADDLVYTSSSGTRFDKSVIIDGIKKERNDKSNKATDTSAEAPSYWAEETDVRMYGTTAIVAFKLGAKWKEDKKDKFQFYYNTGTLLKRDGQWKVIAWQATKIPESNKK